MPFSSTSTTTSSLSSGVLAAAGWQQGPPRANRNPQARQPDGGACRPTQEGNGLSPNVSRLSKLYFLSSTMHEQQFP